MRHRDVEAQGGTGATATAAAAAAAPPQPPAPRKRARADATSAAAAAAPHSPAFSATPAGALAALAHRVTQLDPGEGELSEAACRAAESSLGCAVIHACPGALPQTGTISVRAAGPWRLLRFDESEQGICYTSAATGEADAAVLGLDYIRAMAAAGVAFCEAGGAARSLAAPGATALCVGLGTGALPCFLSAQFPTCRVRVFELDAAVTACVRGVLRQRLTLAGEEAGVACPSMWVP